MIRQLFPVLEHLDTPGALEEAYRHPSERHLRTNFVCSLDGAIEIDGLSAPLGVPADRAAFFAMRAVADVILVGAGTARAEGYGPIRMDGDRVKRRVSRGQRDLPRLAIVSRSAVLETDSKLFASQPAVIVYTTHVAESSQHGLSDVAEVVALGDEDVDLPAVVADLRSRGMGRILCEGGPSLFGALMRAGLVDEVCLTVSPIIAGQGRVNLGEAAALTPAPLSLVAISEGDGALLLRYRPLLSN